MARTSGEYGDRCMYIIYGDSQWRFGSVAARWPVCRFPLRGVASAGGHRVGFDRSARRAGRARKLPVLTQNVPCSSKKVPCSSKPVSLLSGPERRSAARLSRRLRGPGAPAAPIRWRVSPFSAKRGKVARSAGWGAESRDASSTVRGDARAIRVASGSGPHPIRRHRAPPSPAELEKDDARHSRCVNPRDFTGLPSAGV